MSSMILRYLRRAQLRLPLARSITTVTTEGVGIENVAPDDISTSSFATNATVGSHSPEPSPESLQDQTRSHTTATITGFEPINYRSAPEHLNFSAEDVILPQFWMGYNEQDTATFTVDCGGNLSEADLAEGSILGSHIKQVYDDLGLVLVTNTGTTDFSVLKQLTKFGLTGLMDYEAGANPRDEIDKNVFEVGAPLAAHLQYHHEMAYVNESTKSLCFMCAASPGQGRGSTFVSDGVKTTEYILSTELGQKLKDKGVCYIRNLTDAEQFQGKIAEGVYNHWQKSCSTSSQEEAEEMAQQKGLMTEWGPNRLLKTRYYTDAFEYFPQLDRNLFYSSLADHGMWFDGWPLVMHLPYDQRPLHMTFGDDTEFTVEERQQWVNAYDRFGTQLDYAPGDLAMFCNYRWAHGRPAITLQPGEVRELGVVLGEKFRRVGQLPDKW